MNNQSATLDEIRVELGKFPASVVDEFDKARAQMPPNLTDSQMREWANSGLQIAQETVRSWEAAAEFYKVSARVLGICR